MKLSRGYAEVLRNADEISRRIEAGEKYSAIHRDLVERGIVSIQVQCFRIWAKRLTSFDNLSVSRLFQQLPKDQSAVPLIHIGRVAA